MTLPNDPAFTPWLMPLAQHVFGLAVLAAVVAVGLVVITLVTVPLVLRFELDVLAIVGQEEVPESSQE